MLIFLVEETLRVNNSIIKFLNGVGKVIVNNKEEQEILKTYNITKGDEIPEISRFDPVSIAIGLRPNELCEITRPSTSSITSMYYRICKA